MGETRYSNKIDHSDGREQSYLYLNLLKRGRLEKREHRGRRENTSERFLLGWNWILIEKKKSDFKGSCLRNCYSTSLVQLRFLTRLCWVYFLDNYYCHLQNNALEVFIDWFTL